MIIKNYSWNLKTFNVESVDFLIGCDASRYWDCGTVCPRKCKNGCDAFNGSCIHGCSNENALTIDCIGKVVL